ncbi:hypothetical protein BSLG_008533 [Batrachochytrium salamandrivorans]|nr:hypothetical protein BSLG_008533 [Batrachochytrium salamandrivorans]
MLIPSVPSLPIVDISPFVSGTGTQEQKAVTAKAVDSACREFGFFYLVGHGLSEAEVAEIRELSKEFFELPISEKEEISISKTDLARGYQCVGQNITQYAKDWHEGIDLYAPVGADHIIKQRGLKTLAGVNPVPARPANFGAIVDRYVLRMRSLGMATMQAMALGLGISEHYFDSSMDDSFWVMRMIGYPPLSKETDNVGISCGEHTDYGCLTILNTDETTGALQVKAKSGEWISADPIPGAFVINIGDMVNPNFNAVVSPLAECIAMSGKPALYQPVMYGDHLLGKVTDDCSALAPIETAVSRMSAASPSPAVPALPPRVPQLQNASCTNLLEMLQVLMTPAALAKLGGPCCKWSSGSLGSPTIQQRLALGPLAPGLWVTCDGPNVAEIYIDGHSEYSFQGTLAEANFPGPLTSLRLIVLTNHKLLSGSIPDLSQLVQLQHLDLHGNGHVGLLPATLSSATTLRHLDLSSTMISGDIPWNFPVTFPTLAYLNISDTYVSDVVPDLSHMRGLTTCVLGGIYMCTPKTLPVGTICTAGLKMCLDDNSHGAAAGDAPAAPQRSGLYMSSITIAGLCVACISILTALIFVTIKLSRYRREHSVVRRAHDLNRLKSLHDGSELPTYTERGRIVARQDPRRPVIYTTPAELDYSDALERMRNMISSNNRGITMPKMDAEHTPPNAGSLPMFVVLKRTNTVVTLSSFSSAPRLTEDYTVCMSDEDQIGMRLSKLEYRILGDQLAVGRSRMGNSLDVRNGGLDHILSRRSYDDINGHATSSGARKITDESALQLLNIPLNELPTDNQELRSYLLGLLTTAQQRDLDVILRDMCLSRIEACLGEESVVILRRDGVDGHISDDDDDGRGSELSWNAFGRRSTTTLPQITSIPPSDP